VASVVLKAGRAKSVRNRHPWVFSGAIARVMGEPASGSLVEVLDHDGTFLARGYYNSRSQIIVRLLTWQQDEAIDASFWRRRVEQAIRGRKTLAASGATDAFRLVHAESDLMPGLVVDRYSDYLAVQVLTLGMEQYKSEIVRALVEEAAPLGIYERSDVDVRDREGLALATGVLWGVQPPDLLSVQESGRRFWVDMQGGQKTGFYLDQRDNRARLAGFVLGRTVLNAFAYTGGFGVYAATAGAAHCTHVDTSAEALNLARRNVEENAPLSANEYVTGDVFAVLRKYRAEGRKFGVIVLDPPKFAQSRGQVLAACHGYQDINRLAFQILEPDGVLFTMSCSGLVSSDLFQKVVFAASVEAQRDAQIVGKLTQAGDHPVLLSFPEGEYLKGLICRVL
jgi:23S rRNA (cytosine1962-C5)-methyltransferase